MKKLALLLIFATAAVQSQAAIVSIYDLIGTAGAGLLPGNEPGTITGGTGGEIGTGIRLDDNNDADPNTNTLQISVGWGSSQGFSDLAGTASNSHIHGPTTANNGNNGTGDFRQTSNTTIALTRSSNVVTGGTIIQDVSFTAAQVTDLNNGKFYINIHTTANTGGEMRGFIVPVPEPASAGLAALGALMLATRRNRRTAAGL